MTTALEPPAVHRHSLVEDVVGLVTGVVLVAVGLSLLRAVSAVTGGTAGLALLVHYSTGWDLSLLLVAVNLPFYLLAIGVKGVRFTIRSLLAVLGVSAISAAQQELFTFTIAVPWYAIAVGNLLIGVGILVLFRHQSSVGGFSILALVAQERLRWPAGYVQLALDLAVVVAALWAVDPVTVPLSAAGVVLLNLVLALNHKPGRYLGY